MKFNVSEFKERVELEKILEFARIGIVNQLVIIENCQDKSTQKVRNEYLSLLYKVDKEIIALEAQYQRELYTEIRTDMG